MRAGCGGDCLIVRDRGAQPGVEVGDSQLHRPDTLGVRGQRRECAPSREAAVEAAQAAEGSSTERHAAGGDEGLGRSSGANGSAWLCPPASRRLRQTPSPSGGPPRPGVSEGGGNAPPSSASVANPVQIYAPAPCWP